MEEKVIEKSIQGFKKKSSERKYRKKKKLFHIHVVTEFTGNKFQSDIKTKTTKNKTKKNQRLYVNAEQKKCRTCYNTYKVVTY